MLFWFSVFVVCIAGAALAAGMLAKQLVREAASPLASAPAVAGRADDDDAPTTVATRYATPDEPTIVARPYRPPVHTLVGYATTSPAARARAS